MKLSDLLVKLQGLVTQESGWKACCPAHSDADPSLSIRKLGHGKVYLKCFAGCEYDTILAALDVSRDDLDHIEDDEPTVTPTARTGVEITPAQIAGLQATADQATPALLANVEALDYVARRWGATSADVERLGLGYSDQDGGRVLAFIRNAKGQAVGVQGRAVADDVTPKWDTPSGTGYWRAGFLGTPSGTGPVLITEGPGDGITAAVAGYDTVPVFGATSGAQVARLAEALEGREVYVFGDNDAPGQKFAAKVAETLPGARVVTVPDPHNDLADWRASDPASFAEALAARLAEAIKPRAGTSKASEGKADGGMTVETVMRFIQTRYDLLRSEDGIAYAVPKGTNARKIAVEVASLTPELSARIWEERKRIPGRSTIPAALMTAQGVALQRPITPLALRSAVLRDDRGVVIQIDLGDESGQFVEVTAQGWEVLPTSHTGPRATFRRTSATHALPVPRRGGTRDQLRTLLGLDSNDPAWALIWGWLVSSWFADIPRPVLWISGPQGSGKSTRAEMVLNLVDPATALSSEPGKNHRDDTVAALGRYVPSWDNVTTVSAATSDWFCRLVTGANTDGRELYTNDGLRVRNVMRTGMATSISLPFGLKPDALERMVRVEFERMANVERKTETDLEAQFRQLRSYILGAVLDDLAGVLAQLEAVKADAARPADARQFELARMADYSQILHALDLHVVQAPGESFAAAYLASVHTSLQDLAEDDPLLTTIRDEVRAAGGVWRGTAQALLLKVKKRLMAHEDLGDTPAPKTGKGMGDLLRAKSEALRAIGVTRRPSTDRRKLELIWTAPDDYEPEPPATPEADLPLRTPAPEQRDGQSSLEDVLV